MGEGRKGKDNPSTGQKRTEESKRKMSEAAKKRWANKKLLSNK
jgi:hypothetical protein